MSDRTDAAGAGRRIAVIGLGYVGLPVACAFAGAGAPVIGFDINPVRVRALAAGQDHTGEVEPAALAAPTLTLTTDPAALRAADFFVITVPTPVTKARQPDLDPLRAASRTVGGVLKRGDVVVYESTVYPGATEEDCVPVLETASGLKAGADFGIGYSPERINPGDADHRFTNITKVVAGGDAATLDIVAAVYGSVVTAGIHRAPTIRVAEAAKVIENTQRDLNIALMNELAIIFGRLGIRTRDVLDAAFTKWNFMRFTPGLVGGHCIGVDPYYLTARAERAGHHSEVILAGRRINDSMGTYVAQTLIKQLIRQDRPVKGARVGLLGLAFKENVPDLRNSKVIDIFRELQAYGITPLIHDPLVDPAVAEAAYGVALAPAGAFRALDALVLAVPHRGYLGPDLGGFAGGLAPGGCLFDVKSVLDPGAWSDRFFYWSL